MVAADSVSALSVVDSSSATIWSVTECDDGYQSLYPMQEGVDMKDEGLGLLIFLIIWCAALGLGEILRSAFGSFGKYNHKRFRSDDDKR